LGKKEGMIIMDRKEITLSKIADILNE